MIIYFSGTGNCKYVAKQIAAAVDDKAVSVENSDGRIALKKGEVLGMVFPTHFWELPAIMRAFMEKVSITAEGENYTFAIATYGTTPGCSGTDAKKLMRKKGIDLIAAFSLKMPDNWTPMFDLSDAEKVRRQNVEADKNLAVLIGNIKARVKGNHATPKAPYFVRTMSDKMYLKARRTSNFYVEDSFGVGVVQAARLLGAALHALPALPAPVPEILHSVRRRQNKTARAVSSSVND